MLYDLVTKVVEDIFKNNPGIIPTPPPGQMTGPIIGVTDGSVAGPGEVGEVLRNIVTGTVGVSAGLGSASIAALTLTPGDWDVQTNIQFTDNTTNLYMNGLKLDINNGATNILEFLLLNQFTASAGGFAEGDFSTHQYALSTATPVLLTGNLTVYGSGGTVTTGTATYTVTTAARRRR